MKKMILMLLFVVNLFAMEGLEDNFGSLLKIGITRFQGKAVSFRNETGAYSIIADGKEFINEKGNVVTFYISNGKIAYENNIYQNISLEKIDPQGIFSVSKDGKTYGRYRGNFELKIVSGNIMPINRVYAEEYLYSVVPSEIGNNFPDEAIKAQAVAARTYLYFNLGGAKYSCCDMLDNISSQMYLGYDREVAKINKLVNETFNEILVYNGKVIQAFFHSTSGGKTASNENVWPSGKPIPYLRSVDDSENGTISPRHSWILELTKNEFNKLAGFDVDKIDIVEVGEGRVKYLELVGKIKKKITGEELRRIIGVTKLNSTLFTLSETEDKYIFTGNGFGHGLGMPQYSAYTMAEKGKSYIDILTYYYTGVKLTKVKE